MQSLGRSSFARFLWYRLVPDLGRRRFLNHESRILWEKELARLGLHLQTLASDFERTTFLREYTGSLLAIGRPDGSSDLLPSTSFESLDLSKMYLLFKSHALPAECGITSLFYIKLVHAFGFKAYQYSFGFTNEPYTQFIHSIGLVEIECRGSTRLIVQDPYWNLTYRERTGDPMDFFDFLAAINRREYERIVMDSSSVKTALMVPDPSIYSSALSDECKALMAEAFKSSDGSRKIEIPITRNYATLMQSPSHHVENAFVEALRQHGFHEPFLYAYRLRAAGLTGAPNPRALQRKIDAVLR